MEKLTYASITTDSISELWSGKHHSWSNLLDTQWMGHMNGTRVGITQIMIYSPDVARRLIKTMISIQYAEFIEVQNWEGGVSEVTVNDLVDILCHYKLAIIVWKESSDYVKIVFGGNSVRIHMSFDLGELEKRKLVTIV